MKVFRSLLLALVLSVAAQAATLSPGLYENEKGSPLLPVLKAAKRTLDIAIYSMADMEVLETVQKAVARGVRVRVVKEGEPVGDVACRVFSATPVKGEEPSCPAQRKLREIIVKAGGAYVPYEKATFCPDPKRYCFMHGKLVIADSQAALISTGNFDATSLCDTKEAPLARCNRDFTYLTADPITVKTFQAVFEGDLTRRAYNLPALLGGQAANRVTVSPYSMAPMVRLIQAAKKYVRIENQYLNDPTLNKAILEVAKRGVKVDILVSSVCAFGKPDQFQEDRTRQTYGAFDAAGIRTRMFTSSLGVGRHPGYLHAKAIIVDDAAAWVGSTNGSTNALNNNREFGVFLGDKASISGLASHFDRDFASNGSETWEESLRCAKDTPFK